jgi:hypothetical protein
MRSSGKQCVNSGLLTFWIGSLPNPLSYEMRLISERYMTGVWMWQERYEIFPWLNVNQPEERKTVLLNDRSKSQDENIPKLRFRSSFGEIWNVQTSDLVRGEHKIWTWSYLWTHAVNR